MRVDNRSSLFIIWILDTSDLVRPRCALKIAAMLAKINIVGFAIK